DEPLTQYGGEGTEFTTNKGELEIKNLPYRTYYLREKKAPNGYEVLKDPIEIVLDNNNKKIEQVVKNTKEKTKITATKVWEYGPEEKPTIYFKLYRQIEGGDVEEVQNAEKKELVNGTTKVEWTDLDKTDID